MRLRLSRSSRRYPNLGLSWMLLRRRRRRPMSLLLLPLLSLHRQSPFRRHRHTHRILSQLRTFPHILLMTLLQKLCNLFPPLLRQNLCQPNMLKLLHPNMRQSPSPNPSLRKHHLRRRR